MLNRQSTLSISIRRPTSARAESTSMGERFTSTVLSIQCGPDERSTVHGPNLPKSDLFISCRTHYQKVARNHHIVTFSSPRIDGQWARQPNPHGVETDPSRSKYGDMGFVGWIGASGSVMQWHPGKCSTVLSLISICFSVLYHQSPAFKFRLVIFAFKSCVGHSFSRPSVDRFGKNFDWLLI